MIRYKGPFGDCTKIGHDVQANTKVVLNLKERHVLFFSKDSTFVISYYFVNSGRTFFSNRFESLTEIHLHQ